MVHLTRDAGLTFVDGALRAAEDFFGAELVDLEPNQESMEKNIASGSNERVNEKNQDDQKKIGEQKGNPFANETKLERSLQQINEKINRRNENDNLIFARIRDELDTISNTKKEERIIITGLVSNEPIPTALDERKAWLARFVASLLNRLDVELAKKHTIHQPGEEQWKGHTHG
jgi:hypothetical protein